MKNIHPSASKRTIVVVDDDSRLLAMLQIMLEGNHFNVTCANSGQQLFDGLEEQKPDLIILDIMMPHMDGLAVLKRLKETAETSAIPVILLTAKVQQEDMLRGYKLGADYYICKPFTSAKLIKGINLILTGDQKHLNQLDQFFET